MEIAVTELNLDGYRACYSGMKENREVMLTNISLSRIADRANERCRQHNESIEGAAIRQKMTSGICLRMLSASAEVSVEKTPNTRWVIARIIEHATEQTKKSIRLK